MNDYKIKCVEELEHFFEIMQEIVIYGAGKVSKELFSFLINRKHDLKNVKYIVVSDRNGNPDNIAGIPVCAINEAGIGKNDLIIIAVLENIQMTICNELTFEGYKNIRSLSNAVYKELCQANKYLYDANLSSDQYEAALKKWYQERTGLKLNLDNPQTFNEKIQWIKLHDITQYTTLLTDKLAVREWIKEKIGEEYLIPLIGAWDKFDDIEIEKLPKCFVLKCNHGCAWNEIVTDKLNWDVQSAKKKFDRWINTNYAFRGGLQLQYKDIVPKIIAEEYMENEAGDLYDYKFWCFNGKVEFIMFLSERKKGLRMNNYDRNWNLLPFFTGNYLNNKRKIKPPKKLEEMIALAENLSEGFRYVRVDLYLLNDGSIKFGEMTFTPRNGVCKWSNSDIDRYLGSLINCN